ncbi:MAG: DUF815 domain-containing protein, partial [Clostridia bacterium]|nr:DUF815 domain-containing protein [Clostridia bacterium]
VRPENALIYATSNRRHIIRESFSDREGDDIHRNDTIQENLSLSDRFGLSVCFTKPDKNEYIDIIMALAKDERLNIGIDELTKGAEKFAIERGGRSPRCAKQYISSLKADIKINKS